MEGVIQAFHFAHRVDSVAGSASGSGEHLVEEHSFGIVGVGGSTFSESVNVRSLSKYPSARIFEFV